MWFKQVSRKDVALLNEMTYESLPNSREQARLNNEPFWSYKEIRCKIKHYHKELVELFNTSFDDLPMWINNETELVQVVLMWRLKIRR